MHNQRKLIATVSLCLGITATGVSNAALVDRGGGLIYDTDLDVTWLADANYAQTSGYDADGKMNWADAETWTANLTYYDNVRNVSYSDWRLPTTPNGYMITCEGYNCTSSELGHLFYTELGGTAANSIMTSSDPDLALFSNVQSNIYWSSTYFIPESTNAWVFNFNLGDQYTTDKIGSYPCCSSEFYVWAVRDGDVAAAASTVPVPAAVWLFSSGLFGLVGLAQRKRMA